MLFGTSRLLLNNSKLVRGVVDCWATVMHGCTYIGKAGADLLHCGTQFPTAMVTTPDSKFDICNSRLLLHYANCYLK